MKINRTKHREARNWDEPATDRQKEVLDAILAHIAEYGYNPTLQELSGLIGNCATYVGANVSLVKALLRKGYLRTHPHQKIHYKDYLIGDRVPKNLVSETVYSVFVLNMKGKMTPEEARLLAYQLLTAADSIDTKAALKAIADKEKKKFEIKATAEEAYGIIGGETTGTSDTKPSLEAIEDSTPRAERRDAQNDSLPLGQPEHLSLPAQSQASEPELGQHPWYEHQSTD